MWHVLLILFSGIILDSACTVEQDRQGRKEGRKERRKEGRKGRRKRGGKQEGGGGRKGSNREWPLFQHQRLLHYVHLSYYYLDPRKSRLVPGLLKKFEDSGLNQPRIGKSYLDLSQSWKYCKFVLNLLYFISRQDACPNLKKG